MVRGANVVRRSSACRRQSAARDARFALAEEGDLGENEIPLAYTEAPGGTR